MDKLLTGLAQSEQAVVRRLRDQLVVDGWSVVEEISNTASDADFAFSSVSVDPSYGTLYARARGYSGYIHLYAYSEYVDSTTVSGEVHDSTYSRVFVPSSEFRYWLFTNEDAIKLALHDISGDKVYHGYIGRVESVYPPYLDAAPLIVFGTHNDSSYWGDGLSARVLDYYGNTVPATAWSALDASVSGSSFCGGFSTFSLIVTSSGSYPEVRGAVPGVRNTFPGHAPTGYSFVTASGVYYSFSKSGSLGVGYAYGPVSNPRR